MHGQKYWYLTRPGIQGTKGRKDGRDCSKTPASGAPNRSGAADLALILALSIANRSDRHIVSAMLTRYALRLAGIAIIAGAGISRGATPIEMYPGNTSGALVSRPSDYALATVADDGTRTFTVDGRTGDGFHWFLSIGDDAAAKCRVQYSITGENVGRFEARHNV